MKNGNALFYRLCVGLFGLLVGGQSVMASSTTYVALHNASTNQVRAKFISVTGPSFTYIYGTLNSYGGFLTNGQTTASSYWAFGDYANGGGTVVVVIQAGNTAGPTYTNTFTIAPLASGSRYVTWDLLTGPVVSDYTACNHNYGVQWAVGWWTLNGETVHSEAIAPGGEKCYTFHSVLSTDVLQWGIDSPKLAVNLDTNGLNWHLVSTNDNVFVWSTNATTNASYTNSEVAPVQQSYSNFLSGGAINWTGTDGGDVARDSTLQAGFNALLAGQTMQTMAILQGQGSNVSGGMTLDQYEASGSNHSAALQGMLDGSFIDDQKAFAQGQEAALLSASGIGGLGSVAVPDLATPAGGDLTFTVGTGTASPKVVNLGATITSMGVFDFVNVLGRIVILLLLAKMNFDLLYRNMIQLFTVPQARTAGTEALGTNVNAAAALLVGAGVVALIFTLPAVFVPTWVTNTGVSDAISSGTSAWSSLIGSPVAVFVLKVVPVGTIWWAFLSHLTLRMVSGALTIGIAAVVKMMVGL